MGTLGLLGQSIIFGILTGSLYGLVAVGMSVILGVMGLLFAAYGSIMMLGAYLGYFLFTYYGLDPFIAFPIAGVILFIAGLGIYKIFYSQLLRYPGRSKLDTSLLISFGLYVIINAAATLLFTADERGIHTTYIGDAFSFYGMRVPYASLGAMCVSAALVVILMLVLDRTYFGKSIRATQEDWQAAALMGINVDRIYLLAFALGISMAAAGGTMIATLQSFSPAMGLTWLIRGVVVMILAGMGRIGGIFAAGMLLGVVESISAVYLGGYTQAVGLVAFLLVLMFKPQGLFGKKD